MFFVFLLCYITRYVFVVVVVAGVVVVGVVVVVVAVVVVVVVVVVGCCSAFVLLDGCHLLSKYPPLDSNLHGQVTPNMKKRVDKVPELHHGLMGVRQGSHTKKNGRTKSMKYWLFNQDPYHGLIKTLY